MRTIDDVRRCLLSRLEGALQMPAMWGGGAGGIQQFFDLELKLLCWIDEREQERNRAYARFFGSDSLGIIGELAGQHLNWPDYANEVVSVYAQVIHSLGYWRPSRILDAGEWLEMRTKLGDFFFERDWTESEILAQFGEPSFKVGGPFTVVRAYAPSDAQERWIYFDFARKHFPIEHQAYLSDPWLRDVRMRGNCMKLLPFAHRCRPGREVLSERGWVPAAAASVANPELGELDIDAVIAEVQRHLPSVVVQRLRPRHYADMFAIWYFGWDGESNQIGLSSLIGHAPFFVNFPQSAPEYNRAKSANSRQEAVQILVSYLSSNRERM